MGEPCKCHHNFAYVAPMHSGHCCFIPFDRTCHQQEVAIWESTRAAMDSEGRDNA